MKTFRGKVVSTSFLLYLTALRRIVGDVTIYRKFALKVPTLSENANFDRFRLMVAQPWQLAKNVLLSLIGSWLCTFHWVMDEPCALPLSLPKGGSKREFFNILHCLSYLRCR